MDRTGWKPANDGERALRAAWAAEDPEAFADVLTTCDLYLPGFPEDDPREQRLLTRQLGERTFVLVFTSVEALLEGVGVVTEAWRRVTFAELAGAWPDPQWGLAISPQTPIGAYLGPEEVRLLIDEVDAEPAFAGDERERAMRAAQQEGDAEVYLDLLVICDVLVPVTAPATAEELDRPDFPWSVTRSGGDTSVAVFTSAARLRDALPAGTPVVRVPFVDVVRAWPSDRWRMAVNPGSAIASAFPGAQVPDLLRWAQGLVLRFESRSAPAPAADGAPVMRRVQAEIGDRDVQRYLTEGHNRIDGLVRAAGVEVTPDGHLIRWYEEEIGSSDRPEAGLVLPHGAQLVKVIGGQELVLAIYDAELSWWRPSILNVLRGL